MSLSVFLKEGGERIVKEGWYGGVEAIRCVTDKMQVDYRYARYVRYVKYGSSLL